MRAAKHRAAALAAFVLVLFGTALVVTAVAQAAPACAKQVVADWYDNGRVDRVYDLNCYEAAIDSLPVDVRDYSSAREDIQRALQAATRGQNDAGNGSGATPAPTTTQASTQPPPPPPPPPVTTSSSGDATTSTATSSTKSTTSSKPKTTTAKTTPATGNSGTVAEAVEPVDSSGPSTVPMPLIVLGGLALLLLAAGSAGYITRRVQSRRSGGGDPPAAA